MAMILVNGDSWSGGETYRGPEDFWSFLLAQQRGLTVVNLAVSGASNQQIFRTTVDYLYSNNELPTHIIIGWPGIERYELPSSQGRWFRITAHNITRLHLDGTPVLNYDQTQKLFYGSLYNEELMKHSFIQNLLVLQDLCAFKNIKLLNFNSYQAKEWINDNNYIDSKTWVLPPHETMDQLLVTKGHRKLPSGHTDRRGQKAWAVFINQHVQLDPPPGLEPGS